MPARVVKRGSKWAIVGPTGKTYGKSTTKRKAKISASYRNRASKRKR
jgi:hypothetical protein